MPEGLARFLLQRRWIIHPGLESSDPVAATDRYIDVLARKDRDIASRRVLVFGYGGRFAVSVELLRRGAAHVILCDHFVLLDHERNLQLLPQYADYLSVENGAVRPKPAAITLLHGDVRESSLRAKILPVDLVLSTSVYEHLDDAAGITRALASVTKPDGAHLHFVDLRDHYFKFPFEMLSYSERVWKSLLNPTSNLNRLRLRDYRRIFEASFGHVNLEVTERLEREFEQARPRIRPEFLTGDVSEDSAALIQVWAETPHTAR